ncbi:hypothetical protein OPV22_020316 [Ensete ventricosum]|uniref:Secreted protein n=1 Tax=Ensete ventricosum TaxID=4639 RepID=A0AAV8QPJ1_ENSVE|nr:hypothetical protein OPV22_020316 [Ensete ventricosum]
MRPVLTGAPALLAAAAVLARQSVRQPSRLRHARSDQVAAPSLSSSTLAPPSKARIKVRKFLITMIMADEDETSVVPDSFEVSVLPSDGCKQQHRRSLAPSPCNRSHPLPLDQRKRHGFLRRVLETSMAVPATR